ncbi:MAG: hypothetical protein SPD11_13280 [Sphaerochaetaceae bacterium]|nr:hypothetical protein [Sphaerochaetaceae bacterium]
MTLNRRTVLPYVRPADDAVSDASSKARPAKEKHYSNKAFEEGCIPERCEYMGHRAEQDERVATPVRPSENNAVGQFCIERLAAKGDAPQTRKKTADSTPVRPPG